MLRRALEASLTSMSSGGGLGGLGFVFREVSKDNVGLSGLFIALRVLFLGCSGSLVLLFQSHLLESLKDLGLSSVHSGRDSLLFWFLLVWSFVRSGNDL